MTSKELLITAVALALAYVIYKKDEWARAMDTLSSSNYDKVSEERKQYAPQWSDRYDWMQGVEKRGEVIYI